MPTISTKRSIMTLFSDPTDIYSHQVRIVLAEKGVGVDILTVAPPMIPKEVTDSNPYKSFPTLFDRDLVLYDARIIMEYLDERFPHPPLLPVYPVSRAKHRLMMYRIERDWYSLLEATMSKDSAAAKEQLLNGFLVLLPAFEKLPFFFSEEFSLLDCCLAPLLWRFPGMGITIPHDAKPLLNYCRRLFERPAFQASLTDFEREHRGAVYAEVE